MMNGRMAGHGRGRPVAGEESLSNFSHRRRTVCLTKVFSDGGGWIETPMRNKIKVPLEWRRMRLVSGRSELKVLGLGIGTKWLEPEGRVG